MVQASTTVSVQGAQTIQLNEFLFGVNSLFHADSVTDGSDYNALMSELQPSVVRFPGGTITEEYFDLTNPNSQTATNVLDTMSGMTNPRTRSVTSLTDFLANAEGHGASVLMVLPTYRYFDDATGGLVPNAEAEIKEFVRDLLAGAYGNADIAGFEIGNEWYQSRFSWNVDEFGQIQHQIAEWIDEVYTEQNIVDPPAIYVQAGRTTAENTSLSSHFSSDPGLIDGVITHLYATNSNGFPLAIGSGIENRLDDIEDVWSLGGQISPEIIVSEWNVGEDGPNNTLINGIMRYAPLLRVFVEMVEAGVDIANIWTIQSPGPAGLSGREGTGSNLSPTGLFFSVISEHLPNATYVDLGSASDITDAAGNQLGYQYLFQDNSDSILLLASGVDSDISVTIDVTEIAATDTYVYVTVLSGAPGDSGIEYDSDAARYFRTQIPVSVDANGVRTITVNLGEYEFAQVHFSTGHGVEISGDDVYAIADELIGTDFGDLLEGNAGQDTLVGSHGNDTLDGGEGNDLIDGGQNNDVVMGGGGNDEISGGTGRDSLDGGVGDDSISGGNWHDTIIGGAGADTLAGDNGNDLVFGGEHDDFLVLGNGSDTIDGGNGVDTAVLTSSAIDLLIEQHGAQAISSSGTSHFINIEIFELSDFSDIVAGGEHASEIRLMGGNDTLRFTATGEASWITDTIGVLDGGEGLDVLDLSTSASSISVWLDAGIIETGSGHLEISDFESFVGTAFNDVVSGLAEDISNIDLGHGNDRVFLGNGADITVDTGSGDDFLQIFSLDSGTIRAGTGNDMVFIDGASAVVYAGAGNDHIYSNAATAEYHCGAGNDTIVASSGADTFVFQGLVGDNTIIGFDTDFGQDVIDLRQVTNIPGFQDLIGSHATQTADGALLFLNADSSVLLQGVDLSELNSSLFVFA